MRGSHISHTNKPGVAETTGGSEIGYGAALVTFLLSVGTAMTKASLIWAYDCSQRLVVHE